MKKSPEEMRRERNEAVVKALKEPKKTVRVVCPHCKGALNVDV